MAEDGHPSTTHFNHTTRENQSATLTQGDGTSPVCMTILNNATNTIMDESPKKTHAAIVDLPNDGDHLRIAEKVPHENRPKPVPRTLRPTCTTNVDMLPDDNQTRSRFTATGPHEHQLHRNPDCNKNVNSQSHVNRTQTRYTKSMPHKHQLNPSQVAFRQNGNMIAEVPNEDTQTRITTPSQQNEKAFETPREAHDSITTYTGYPDPAETSIRFPMKTPTGKEHPTFTVTDITTTRHKNIYSKNKRNKRKLIAVHPHSICGSAHNSSRIKQKRSSWIKKHLPSRPENEISLTPISQNYPHPCSPKDAHHPLTLSPAIPDFPSVTAEPQIYSQANTSPLAPLPGTSQGSVNRSLAIHASPDDTAGHPASSPVHDPLMASLPGASQGSVNLSTAIHDYTPVLRIRGGGRDLFESTDEEEEE